MRSSSPARTGRKRTVPPSESTTSLSHCAGYVAMRGQPYDTQVACRTVHSAATDASAATTGLTAAEVAQRVREGKLNTAEDRPSRTLGEIFRANVFTRFNAILGTMFVLILIFGEGQ